MLPTTSPVVLPKFFCLFEIDHFFLCGQIRVVHQSLLVALKGEGFANEVFEFVQSLYGVCFAFRCGLVGNASFLTARYAVSTECFLPENADFHCYVVKVKATTPSARRSWIWSWTVSASSPTTARASRASWCSTLAAEAPAPVLVACSSSASLLTTARRARFPSRLVPKFAMNSQFII